VKTKKKLLGIVGTAALTLGLSTVIAQPANAAASHCPLLYACIWQDTMYATNGNGLGLVKFEYYINNYGSYNFAGTSINSNEKASSVYNHGKSSKVRWFQHPDFLGDLIEVPVGGQDGNIHDAIGVVTRVFHDRISSGKFV
jgi:hypothetical protein